jgi:hypothetical protein
VRVTNSHGAAYTVHVTDVVAVNVADTERRTES